MRPQDNLATISSGSARTMQANARMDGLPRAKYGPSDLGAGSCMVRWSSANLHDVSEAIGPACAALI